MSDLLTQKIMLWYSALDYDITMNNYDIKCKNYGILSNNHRIKSHNYDIKLTIKTTKNYLCQF